jgi:hypothetical protein
MQPAQLGLLVPAFEDSPHAQTAQLGRDPPFCVAPLGVDREDCAGSCAPTVWRTRRGRECTAQPRPAGFLPYDGSFPMRTQSFNAS